ncbi:MAG: 4Fe-4S binding protein [Methanomassiliicoccaceae archaeon]|nr:4Fe-4S binding protein [Methanomassiliicoccaceae archaeon]
MRMIVNKNKCPQDHKCPAIKICAQKAISQATITSLPQIDPELCVMCRKCQKFCPKRAFEVIDE